MAHGVTFCVLRVCRHLLVKYITADQTWSLRQRTLPTVLLVKNQQTWLSTSIVTYSLEEKNNKLKNSCNQGFKKQKNNKELCPYLLNMSHLCFSGMVVKLRDKFRHPECYTCTDCNVNLKQKGHFFVEDKVYCETHARERVTPPEGYDIVTVFPK